MEYLVTDRSEGTVYEEIGLLLFAGINLFENKITFVRSTGRFTTDTMCSRDVPWIQVYVQISPQRILNNLFRIFIVGCNR